MRIVIVVALALVSCGQSPPPMSWNYRHYEIGQEIESPTGGAFMRFTSTREYTKLTQELLYSGRSADIVRVTYREFVRTGIPGTDPAEFARPAFAQEMQYDLSQSDVIVFREWRIRVLEATNEKIRAVVYADPDSPTRASPAP